MEKFTSYWAKFQLVDKNGNVTYYIIKNRSNDTFNSVYKYQFFLVKEKYLNLKMTNKNDEQILFNRWDLYKSENDLDYEYINSFASDETNVTNLLNVENCKIYLNNFNVVGNCSSAYYPSNFVQGSYDKDSNNNDDTTKDDENKNILTSIVDFIKDIVEKIKNLPSLIYNSFSNILDSIRQKIIDLKDKLVELPSLIYENFSTILDNIKKGLGTLKDKILDLPSQIYNFFKDVIDGIKNKVIEIKDVLSNLVQNIVNAFITMLKDLFIPKTSIVDSIKNKFDEKFKIISQVEEQINNFKNIKTTEELPTLRFTYKKKEYNVLDLNSFVSYINIFKILVAAIVWCKFLLSLYHKIPKIIGGFSSVGGGEE